MNNLFQLINIHDLLALGIPPALRRLLMEIDLNVTMKN